MNETPAPASLPTAFVHIDVDALWAVRRCYGDDSASPSADDPVWNEGVPALAELLGELGIRASFFVVGRDLEVGAVARRVGELREAGHAIENHSWSHDLGLSGMSDERLADEIGRTAEAIAAATSGRRPIGFRAPGYDASTRLVAMLSERGYAYDSSVLPTFAGPLLRLADAHLRGAWPKRYQYGGILSGFAPLSPYRIDAARPPRLPARAPADARLWELPIATSPRLRLPIHAGFVQLRGADVLRRALRGLAATPGPLTYLIHGIDATRAGGERFPVPTGRGRRAFDGSAAEKLASLRAILRLLAEHRTILHTPDWLTRISRAAL
jgi:hypothetical protein